MGKGSGPDWAEAMRSDWAAVKRRRQNSPRWLKREVGCDCRWQAGRRAVRPGMTRSRQLQGGRRKWATGTGAPRGAGTQRCAARAGTRDFSRAAGGAGVDVFDHHSRGPNLRCCLWPASWVVFWIAPGVVESWSPGQPPSRTWQTATAINTAQSRQGQARRGGARSRKGRGLTLLPAPTPGLGRKGLGGSGSNLRGSRGRRLLWTRIRPVRPPRYVDDDDAAGAGQTRVSQGQPECCTGDAVYSMAQCGASPGEAGMVGRA